MKIRFVKRQAFLMCKWRSDAYRPLPCRSFTGTWPGICKLGALWKFYPNSMARYRNWLIQGKSRADWTGFSGTAPREHYPLPLNKYTYIHASMCFNTGKQIFFTVYSILEQQFIPSSGLPPAVHWHTLLHELPPLLECYSASRLQSHEIMHKSVMLVHWES